MVTASNIPVPEPIAPTKSAKIVKAPIHIPPNVAAIGMYLFNFSFMLWSLNPLIKYPWSCKFLATSLTPDPETSIQVFENKAHEMRINAI